MNDFHVLINGLIHARRKDALEMGKALAQANQAAEAEVRAARQVLEEQRCEIADQEAQIAQYKARLGL